MNEPTPSAAAPRRSIVIESSRRKLPAPWLWAAGVALAAAILALWRLSQGVPTVSAEDLRFARVEAGTLLNVVSGQGILVAADTYAVPATSGGTLTKLVVGAGQAVKPGDVLATLKNADVERQLGQALTELNQDEARHATLRGDLALRSMALARELGELRVEYLSDRLELRAQEDLVARGVVPRIANQRLKLRVGMLREQLQAAEQRTDSLEASAAGALHASTAGLEQRRLVVATARAAVEALTLKAHTGGRVLSLRDGLVEGTPIEPGQVVLRIARSDLLEAELRLPASRVADLAQGQRVHLQSSRAGEMVGSLTQIDPQAQLGQVMARAKLPDEVPVGFVAGLPLSVAVEVDRIDRTLRVRTPAGARSGNSMLLFKLDPERQRLRRIQVEIGAVGARESQIVRGLSAGDVIVVSDLSEHAQAPELRLVDFSPSQVPAEGGGSG